MKLNFNFKKEQAIDLIVYSLLFALLSSLYICWINSDKIINYLQEVDGNKKTIEFKLDSMPVAPYQ